MIGEVRIAATFDMYVNARRSNSPLHSVFIEKYFAASASRRKANECFPQKSKCNIKTDLQKTYKEK